MPKPATPSVTVVGSLNLDLVVRVPRLPHAGETLLAGDYRRTLGGKGANQAVAAAHHGVDVSMIGCVGDDSDGRQLTHALGAEGSTPARSTRGRGCRPASRTSPWAPTARTASSSSGS
jgi:ribokinase